MLGIFRNTLTGNGNYPVQDSENLSSRIQMELYLKPKIFSYFLVPFLEAPSNFKHFEQKNHHHYYFISEITDCERLGETTL